MKTWIIAFFVVQIVVDLAHSVTVFPFVHYGMFSESFARPDSLALYRVSVDGSLLRPEDFPVYKWDMVQGALEMGEKRAATGDFATDKERLREGLGAVGLGRLYNRLRPNLDNEGDGRPGAEGYRMAGAGPEPGPQFLRWYKGYLGRLLGRPVGVLRVDKAWYRWEGGRIQLIRTENWLNG